MIVAGVGRSGTSLFTSILTLAGFHVPQPEVLADPTNPKGFGESRWVVDFHRRQLRSAPRVGLGLPALGLAGHRPSGRGHRRPGRADGLAEGAVRRPGRRRGQGPADRLVPAALGEGRLRPRRRGVVRHDAATPGRGGDQRDQVVRRLAVAGEPDRLMAQHHARDRARHPRQASASSSGTTTCSPTGPRSSPAPDASSAYPRLQHVDADARAAIDAQVDPTLHRQKVGFDDLGVPASVEQLAAAAWSELVALAAPGGDGPAAWVGLDECREAYRSFYAEVESIAQSSLHALRPEGGGASSVGRDGRSPSRGPSHVDGRRRRRPHPAGRAVRAAQVAATGAARLAIAPHPGREPRRAGWSGASGRQPEPATAVAPRALRPGRPPGRRTSVGRHAAAQHCRRPPRGRTEARRPGRPASWPPPRGAQP